MKIRANNISNRSLISRIYEESSKLNGKELKNEQKT